MLSKLKERVYEANMELFQRGLALYTWGNVSGINKDRDLVVIKPSGVSYQEMDPSMMVVVDLDGSKIQGDLRPSSDTPTHLELYRSFSSLGSIAHTHSKWATIWAQAKLPIPCYGTTHSDYFYGAIPCSKPLTEAQIEIEYERNTGRVIVEAYTYKDLLSAPACLVASHGPFTFGETPAEAVFNSVVLEEIAELAYRSHRLQPALAEIPQELLDKHYFRKHGRGAYYGQKQ